MIKLFAAPHTLSVNAMTEWYKRYLGGDLNPSHPCADSGYSFSDRTPSCHEDHQPEKDIFPRYGWAG